MSFEIRPDAIVVISSMAQALIANVRFGVVPILQSSGYCVVEALKNNTFALEANNENLPSRTCRKSCSNSMTFGTRGCAAAAITFSVEDQMSMKTMLNSTIILTVLALGIGTVINASRLGAEENKTAIAADRVSLFTVPLRCEAAPEIGCGPISKPILLQLEHEPAIAQAWLNGTGTVLAVVWVGNHGQETRTKTVQAVFEKNGLTATELDGEARDTELKSFLSADPWYRGADVDTLSKQEAKRIAARLVRRVQAKVALSPEQAEALETGLVQTFIQAYKDGFAGQKDKEEELKQAMLNVARKNLDQSEFGTFQEALAKGVLPVADDKEEHNTNTPDCCSPKSARKS